MRRVHRQPRDLILEAAGEAGVVAGPRDRGDDHPVTAAAHPRRLAPPESRTSSRDPAPATAGGPRPGHSPGSAAGSADSDPAPGLPVGPTPPPPRRSRRARRPRPPLGASPSSGFHTPQWAHVATVPFTWFLNLRSRNRRSAAACAPPRPQVGRSRAPTSMPNSAARRRLSSSANTPQSSEHVSRTSARDRALLDRRRRPRYPTTASHLTHGTCRSALFCPLRGHAEVAPRVLCRVR